MDMQRTGRFLAQLRREHGLTQEQLAERLGTSGRTVSRWETGAYMAPVEMLLALSEMYQVTINELVTGERLTAEAAPARAEENLAELYREKVAFQLQEKKDFWRRKWQKDHRLSLLLALIVLAGVQIAGALLGNSRLMVAGAFLCVAAVLMANNARQAYVEHHLYDE